jgi:hypothetical protein
VVRYRECVTGFQIELVAPAMRPGREPEPR